MMIIQYLDDHYDDYYDNPSKYKDLPKIIVLRVEKLESYEAYKLKSKRFLLMESEAQEKDEVNIEDEQ